MPVSSKSVTYVRLKLAYSIFNGAILKCEGKEETIYKWFIDNFMFKK